MLKNLAGMFVGDKLKAVLSKRSIKLELNIFILLGLIVLIGVIDLDPGGIFQRLNAIGAKTEGMLKLIEFIFTLYIIILLRKATSPNNKGEKKDKDDDDDDEKEKEKKVIHITINANNFYSSNLQEEISKVVSPVKSTPHPDPPKVEKIEETPIFQETSTPIFSENKREILKRKILEMKRRKQ